MDFKKIYNNFFPLIQEDIKAVEIGIYMMSGTLLSFAYYRIRPITKFGKPSDIPKIFIRKKQRQNGEIKTVTPSANDGLILQIDHKPPLNFLIFSKKLLPIKITGVNVNMNGYSWLQTLSINRKIEFVPILADGNAAECQVFMFCPKYQKNPIDLSEALLSLGFATVSKNVSQIENKSLMKYFKQLEHVEKKAKSNRCGLWSFREPPLPWPIKKFKQLYNWILFIILPANYRLPQLVR